MSPAADQFGHEAVDDGDPDAGCNRPGPQDDEPSQQQQANAAFWRRWYRHQPADWRCSKHAGENRYCGSCLVQRRLEGREDGQGNERAFCVHCDGRICLGRYGWYHDDRADYDCDGVACGGMDDDDGEPLTATPEP